MQDFYLRKLIFHLGCVSVWQKTYLHYTLSCLTLRLKCTFEQQQALAPSICQVKVGVETEKIMLGLLLFKKPKTFFRIRNNAPSFPQKPELWFEKATINHVSPFQVLRFIFLSRNFWGKSRYKVRQAAYMDHQLHQHHAIIFSVTL